MSSRSHKPKSKCRPKPKTLREFLEAPPSDARTFELGDALDRHVFNVKIYGKEWQVFHFTMFEEEGAAASYRYTADGVITMKILAWEGVLTKTQVAGLIRAAVVIDPALG